MNRRATIVLLILAVLLAAFLALTRSGTLSLTGDEEEEGDPSLEVQALFEEAATDYVTAFSITDNETDERFAAELGEDAEWAVTQTATPPEPGLVADTMYLSAAANAITTMTSSRRLSDVESLDEYGLDPARYTLGFTTSSEAHYTLDIGEKTVEGSLYYTQRRGHETVHLVSAAIPDAFIDLLHNPPYTVPTPTPEPTPESTPTS